MEQKKSRVVAANALYMVMYVSSGVLLQLYLKELGASPFMISLQEVFLWTGLLLFAPLWGSASDVSGRRKPFLIGGLLVPVLALLGMAAVNTVVAVLALRLLFAVGVAMFPPVMLAIMTRDSDVAHRSQTFAVYTRSRAAGFFIGWASIGFLADMFGFQNAFILLSSAGLLGLLAVTRLQYTEDDDTALDLQAIWADAKQHWVPSFRETAFQKHGLHLLYVGIFLRKAGLIGVGSVIAAYATEVIGLTATLMSILMAANPASQVAFIRFFSRLADRYGRRAVILVGMAGTIGQPFLLAVAEGPLLFGAGFLVVGVSFAAFVQGSTAFIGDVAPDGREGEFMGFRNAFQGLAGVTGPLLAGGLATVYGYRPMLWVMTGLITLGFLLVWYGTEETLDSHDTFPFYEYLPGLLTTSADR